jgi:enamine deaminase RidA (YjgF/YER057c/UK114 family)
MTQATTTSQVESRLMAAGHQVPPPHKPAATYVPYTRQGNVIWVSGQVPMRDGKALLTGKVGAEVTVAQGQEMARACALNAIAVLKQASDGQLDRVRILKTVNFTASAPGFTDVHVVANGASELFILAFGENGKHARSSIGVAELPFNVPFECEVVAVIE